MRQLGALGECSQLLVGQDREDRRLPEKFFEFGHVHGNGAPINFRFYFETSPPAIRNAAPGSRRSPSPAAVAPNAAAGSRSCARSSTPIQSKAPLISPSPVPLSALRRRARYARIAGARLRGPRPAHSLPHASDRAASPNSAA